MIRSKDIDKHFKCPVWVADADYDCPTLGWIKNSLNPYYSGLLKELGLDTWKAYWDCDNFACLYFTVAQAFHGQKDSPPQQGLAVGEIWYEPDGENYAHAINCAFLGPEEVIYIEPQGPKVIELSKKEQKSIFYVRF